MRSFLVLVSLSCLVYAGKVEEIWNKIFDTSSDDRAYGVAVDPQHNVYLTGHSVNGNYSCHTVKFSSSGQLQWDRIYDNGADDVGYGAAIGLNYVYVTGYSSNGVDNDLVVIKYKPDGDTFWTRVRDEGNDEEGRAILVDDNGYIYVVGSSSNIGSSSIILLKYNQNGDTVWTRTYGVSGWDAAFDMKLAGNFIYIAGCSNNGSDDDFRVMKYDKDGSLQWTRQYDNGGYDDVGNGVAVDEDGAVYITGRTSQGMIGDFMTVKYNDAGERIWVEFYDGGDDDAGHGAVFLNGNIYVTGYSEIGSGLDFMTIKYNPDGDTVWTHPYDSGDNDIANQVYTEDDYFYVTGIYDNGTNSDFRVIKYSDRDIDLTSPNGGEHLVIGQRYDITWDWTGDIDSVVIEYTNEAIGGLDTIAVVLNTGSHSWLVPNNPGFLCQLYVSDVENYTEVRDSTDSLFTISHTGIDDHSNVAKPSLSMGVYSQGAAIRYQVTDPRSSTLRIYAADGTLVSDLTPSIHSPQGEIIWDETTVDGHKVSYGVYFLRLIDSDTSLSRKFVLVR